jgi:hypothetical protein
MRVEPFTPAYLPAVREFNRRLAAGDAPWRFPEDPVPDWLPRGDARPPFQEFFVVLEGEDVRGAYALKHQDVSFWGEVKSTGNLNLPVSEGMVNGRYSLVASQLVNDAVRREPLHFVVGMGGEDARIARVLKAMGWQLTKVPFYFKVLNGYRFLREIRYLRKTRSKAFLLDLAALSGVGWLGAKTANAMLERPLRGESRLVVEVVDRFGSWADDLWRVCAERYAFASVRTSDVLNRVYPAASDRFIRLKVSDERRLIGYAVLREDDTLQAYFGDMRVGMILDCLSLPNDADRVVRAAYRVFGRRGVDVVLLNHSHPVWCGALRRAGFLEGPSNFLFAASKQLANLLTSIDGAASGRLVMRGDGDWPWGVNFMVAPEAQAPQLARA